MHALSPHRRRPPSGGFTRDTDVPYQQSVLMDEALSQHHVRHELITMPGRGHGFDGEMDNHLVKEAFNSVLAFLDEYLKRGHA